MGVSSASFPSITMSLPLRRATNCALVSCAVRLMKLIRRTSRDVFGYAAREKPKQFAESRKGHARREFGSAASPIDVPLNSSSGLPFRNPRSAIRMFFLHHLELFAPLLLMTAERVCTPANSFHDAFELLQLVCGKLREDL